MPREITVTDDTQATTDIDTVTSVVYSTTGDTESTTENYTSYNTTIDYTTELMNTTINFVDKPVKPVVIILPIFALIILLIIFGMAGGTFK